MPTFIVESVPKGGKKTKSVREAKDKQTLIDHLLQAGHTIVGIEEVTEVKAEKFSLETLKKFFRKKDYSPELSIATRQLATLLTAGITVTRSFEILIESAGVGDALKGPFKVILRGINEGKRIDKVMEEFPDVFKPNYRGIVCLGMNTGCLADAFNSLAEDLEKEVSLKRSLSAAMTYPIVTFFLSFVLNIGLFVGVLPKIVDVISDLDTELPWITKILMAIVGYLCNPYLVIISIVLLFFMAYQIFAYASTPVGKYNIDFMKLRLPVLGYIYRCRYAENFCRSLALLIEYSVPIQEAIFIAGKIADNSFMEQQLIYPIIDAVGEGVFIAKAMRATGLMPLSSVNLLAAGEATGDVSACLKDAAKMLELDLTSALQRSLSLIEPIMIISMSMFVLVLVLAVMLPIYQIIQNIGL